MDDPRRNELLSQYDELTMQLLMDEAAEQDGALLWQAFTANGSAMPKDMDDACRKRVDASFRKSARKQRWKKAAKNSLRAAVIAICLVAGIFTVVMKVDALRIPTINYILDMRERYSILNYSDPIHSPVSETLKDTFENVLPVGYVLFKENFTSPDNGSIIYMDDEKMLTLNVLPADATIVLDTENGTIFEAEICHVNTQVFEKDTGHRRICWYNSDRTIFYYLSASDMSFHDLMLIAAPLIEFTAK